VRSFKSEVGKHMRDARRRSVTVALAVLVVLGVLLALLMTACAVRRAGHAIPHTCPPPANYAVVSVAFGGAIRRTADHNNADHNNADHNNADGALCACPFAPMPTPSNDLINNHGCA
jgi:hypothetical protein